MAKDVKVNIVAKDKGSKTVKKFSDNTTSALKKIAGPLALGAVVAGFAKLMNDTVKLGDKFHKLNLKTGVSVTTLSKLKHIANLTGVSFNTVTSSMERMERRIGLAERGLGAAKQAFEELNINIADMIDLSPDEQFLQLGEKILTVENPTRRAALAFEIFGMSGKELMKMLPGLRDRLGEVSSSITQEQADIAAEYTDNMEMFRHNLEKFKMSIFSPFIKGLNSMAKAHRELAAAQKETYKGHITIKDGVIGWEDAATDTESAKRGPSAFDSSKGLAKIAADRSKKPDKDKKKDDGYIEGVILPQAFDIDAYAITLEEKAQVLKDAFDKEQDLKAEMLKFDMELRDLDLQHQIDKALKEKEIDDKRLEDKKAKFKEEQDLLGETSAMLGKFGSMLDMMGADSEENEKKTFKMRKAVAVAQATVDTYKAATKALDEGGTYTGPILAGIMIATGMAQVATIMKTEPKYAKGGVFTNSIVRSPTQFNMAEMGDAGPEAILPLATTSSGELGVKASGGGGQQPIVFNFAPNTMSGKDFYDYTRKNAAAIVAPIIQEIQRGNSSLNANLRRASV